MEVVLNSTNGWSSSLGLLHAGGGCPHNGVHAYWPRASSPRGWRFPRSAPIVRWTFWSSPRKWRSSVGRGIEVKLTSSSPHEWRSSVAPGNCHLDSHIFSTRMEVVRSSSTMTRPRSRLLHVGGGCPPLGTPSGACREASPSRWRLSRDRGQSSIAPGVFSTRMEVCPSNIACPPETIMILYMGRGCSVGLYAKAPRKGMKKARARRVDKIG